jgi:hypothetical protein
MEGFGRHPDPDNERALETNKVGSEERYRGQPRIKRVRKRAEPFRNRWQKSQRI